MTRLLTGTLVAAALALFAADAGAHIDMTYPVAREMNQKAGPCGVAGSVRGTNITTLDPGATITVTWDETIAHTGWFRISFDSDGDDGFIDPASIDDVDNSPTVLIDEIPNPDGLGSYSQEVTLPDMVCDNCTLQLMQVMTDKQANGWGNDEFYYRCADLVLGMGGSTTSTSGNTSSSSTTGGAGGSTSASTGNGTGPASVGAGPGAPPTPVEAGCSVSSGASGGSSPSALWLLAAAGAGLIRLRRRRA